MQAERDAKRMTLGIRQAVKLVQHRRAQPLKGSERQFHLRLDSGNPRNAQAGRRLDRVLKQRRLANPGLPAHHEHAAAPSSRRVKQPTERRAFRETV
jgi:hypothetical protein